MTKILEDLLEVSRTTMHLSAINRSICKLFDGTPESDTDHTVNLSMVCLMFCDRNIGYRMRSIEIGKVISLCQVHDLPEIITGDTQSLGLTEAQLAVKAQDDATAAKLVIAIFADPIRGSSSKLIAGLVAEYEARETPEARVVWAMDKIVPKFNQSIIGPKPITEAGFTADKIEESCNAQRTRIEKGTGGMFPAVIALHREASYGVVDMVRKYQKELAEIDKIEAPSIEGEWRESNHAFCSVCGEKTRQFNGRGPALIFHKVGCPEKPEAVESEKVSD